MDQQELRQGAPIPMRVEGTVGEPEPSPSTLVPPPDDLDTALLIATAHRGRSLAMNNTLYTVRGHSVALLLDVDLSGCYLLKWQTQSKMQRIGR